MTGDQVGREIGLASVYCLVLKERATGQDDFAGCSIVEVFFIKEIRCRVRCVPGTFRINDQDRIDSIRPIPQSNDRLSNGRGVTYQGVMGMFVSGGKEGCQT